MAGRRPAAVDRPRPRRSRRARASGRGSPRRRATGTLPPATGSKAHADRAAGEDDRDPRHRAVSPGPVGSDGPARSSAGGSALAGRVDAAARRRPGDVGAPRRSASRPASAGPRRAPPRSGPRVRVGRRPSRPAPAAGRAYSDRRDARRRARPMATTRMTDGRPDQVGDRPDDDDRQEARDRDEHVQHAEDAAADVLRQVLLELRLRRDGDDAVGDAGEERDDHDDREERRDAPTGRAPPGASARWSSRLIGPATDSAASRSPSAIRPPSMTRRRGRYRP